MPRNVIPSGQGYVVFLVTNIIWSMASINKHTCRTVSNLSVVYHN